MQYAELTIRMHQSTKTEETYKKIGKIKITLE